MRYEPRKELAGLPKTVHGGQAWRLSGVEDFSQNLNPLGPPPELLDEIQKVLAGVGHYPDDSALAAKTAVANLLGLQPENVQMGAGSSEIIRNFPNTFLEPGDRALMFYPSFAEYAQQCRIAGVEVDSLQLLPEDDFRIDTERLSVALRQHPYKALYLCNPNNPTGRVEPREKVLGIVKECADLNILVFLDETLLDLVPNAASVSCAAMVNEYPNLVVASSLTKSFAIPGLRIGYGVAVPEFIAEMEKVRLPWNLGQLEQSLATYLVSDRMDYVTEGAKLLEKENKIMQAQLDEVCFPVGHLSDSFFYFVSTASLKVTGAEMQHLMLKHNIMIRDCASFGPEFADYIRFCVKDRERNQAFVAAAEKVMQAMEGR
ncbi:MAG: histidinol-phosphate transaminase [Methanomethylophilus sp.]